MRLTKPVILEELSPFSPQVIEREETQMGFEFVRLFSADDQNPRTEILYVASPAEVEQFLTREEDGKKLCVVCRGTRAWGEWIAARRDLCLIVVGEETTPGELFNRMLALFERTSKWEQRLDRAIYTKESLQEVINVGSPLFRNPILVWDATFSIEAYSQDKPMGNKHLERAIERRYIGVDRIQDIISKGLMSEPKHNGLLRVLRKEDTGWGYTCYMRHYFHNGHRTFSIAMVETIAPATEKELAILHYFFDRVGEYLDSRMSQGKDYSHLYQAFLQDLLDGKITDAGEIQRRAEVFGVPFELDYLFYDIELEQFTQPQAEFLIYSLYQTLPGERFMIRGNSVCLLKSVKAYSCEQEGPMSRFTGLLDTYNAYCGLSRVFHSLAECRTAYEQARAAVRLGRRLRLDPEQERLFYYREYATFHMLELCEREVDLFSLLPKGVVRFYEADQKNGGHDLKLISTFVDTGMSTAATSQALFLHRNSVTYRLKQIKERWGIDFGNAESLMDILLLLKIIRFRNGGD